MSKFNIFFPDFVYRSDIFSASLKRWVCSLFGRFSLVCTCLLSFGRIFLVPQAKSCYFVNLKDFSGIELTGCLNVFINYLHQAKLVHPFEMVCLLLGSCGPP